MYSNENSTGAFHAHSPMEAEVFKPLLTCAQGKLFDDHPFASPIALNLFFPNEPYPDYVDLLTREIGFYAKHFQHRRLTKIWFRGKPLLTMKAGELAELAFYTHQLFSREPGGSEEYGFECQPSDITPGNLALMKGLRFNHLTFSLNTSLPPKKQKISQILSLIDEYDFQECRYRIDIANTDPDTLICWLDTLITHLPRMIEIQGLDEMDGSVTLASLADHFSVQGYHLLGDRFFVPADHMLLSLKKQSDLQYTPWGLCQRQLGDWLGVGVDALGKLGSGYYQNHLSSHQYRDAIRNNQLPISFSASYAEGHEKTLAWKLVDQLLCYHCLPEQSITATARISENIHEVIAKAEKLAWLNRHKNALILAENGLNHLTQFCQELQSL
ncbi:hypothetical protein [Porticoccus litoralis]|uniref:Uncharacterized protein n=1 Tax=Porticoccus litoralis TaxID=434086 RepID=A0AAW8B004_9GAMM|nr:hypothetical protein [Porticoccus litoralis]MDP1519436.1 hypothetical protein [Porticoccus litoralis]TNE93079.1 MAG: hypothetical protein EP324_03875 [Gammaproteobacteria bacterium]